MDKSIDKPVALVMGAGDAIGFAISECFAEDGYTVCMARRNGEKLAGLIDELAARGFQAHGFSCDARDEDLLSASEEATQAQGAGVWIYKCIVNIA